jgi:hypothetical protein
LFRADRRVAALLVPAPVVFLLVMGLEGRYFGRWLLPAFPFLCVLAAHLTLTLARAAARATARGPHWRRALGLAAGVVLIAAVIAQGLVHSVHAGRVLARTDTRTLTRLWLLAHVPRGAAIVAEPVSPNDWAHEAAPGTSTAANPPRWHKYPSLVARTTPAGALTERLRQVTIEDYERTLAPALVGYYERHGYCWVVTGSTQSGRAFADPRAVPLATAYYRALARAGQVVFRASPYRAGATPTKFNFDWSFDYYPLGYERPGPAITVYRLHGGRCA